MFEAWQLRDDCICTYSDNTIAIDIQEYIVPTSPQAVPNLSVARVPYKKDLKKSEQLNFESQALKVHEKQVVTGFIYKFTITEKVTNSAPQLAGKMRKVSR